MNKFILSILFVFEILLNSFAQTKRETIYSVIDTNQASRIALPINSIKYEPFAQTKRETIYSVSDTNQAFGIALPINSIIYVKNIDRTYIINEPASATQALKDIANKIIFSMYFNGNRTVKRSGIPNVNVGGNNLFEFIENYFFPFVPATISISVSGTVFEVGTNNNININGTTTANDETIFSNGTLKRDGIDIYLFGSNLSFSTTDNFSPTTQQTINYRAYQDVGNNGNSTTIQSNNIQVNSVYTFLYGVSSANLESGGTAIYTALNKLVQLKSNKTVVLNGTNGYIYFAYPSSYGNLTSILDQNGFEQITAFTKYTATVTSVGLPNNYSVTYYIYKLNNITSPTNWSYQFKF